MSLRSDGSRVPREIAGPPGAQPEPVRYLRAGRDDSSVLPRLAFIGVRPVGLCGRGGGRSESLSCASSSSSVIKVSPG